MNIKENIRIAIFSIKSNLMRSLLTMLGIIIGVASVIAVITVGNGGRDYIVGMIRDMGSSAISITVNAANSDISNSDYITDDDINAIKSLDNVQYVSPMVMTLGSLSVDANDKNAIGFIVGGNSDLRYVMNGDCIYGRYFNKTEVEAGRSVCIIDSTSAMQLFGKKDVVGEFVSFNYNDVSVSFKIIGVTDMMSSFGGDSEKMLESMNSLTGGATVTSAMIMVPSILTFRHGHKRIYHIHSGGQRNISRSRRNRRYEYYARLHNGANARNRHTKGSRSQNVHDIVPVPHGVHNSVPHRRTYRAFAGCFGSGTGFENYECSA